MQVVKQVLVVVVVVLEVVVEEVSTYKHQDKEWSPAPARFPLLNNNALRVVQVVDRVAGSCGTRVVRYLQGVI